MPDTLDNIVNSFLYSKADEVIKDILKNYSDCLQRMGYDEVLNEVKQIVMNPEAIITSVGESMEPLKIETSITFACDRCGECCKNFRIGISWADINDYLRDRRYYMLSALVLPEDRNYFQLINKQQFMDADPPYSRTMIDSLLQINQSLDSIGEEDLNSCIFYNPDQHACTIQAFKPLECKIYPVGNIVFGDDENACAKSCFTSGDVLDAESIIMDLEKKRVPDFVLSLLYDVVPDGGWRLDFFKLALLFEKMRTIL